MLKCSESNIIRKANIILSLRKHGIFISDEDVDYIHICDEKDGIITYFDSRTGETITSNLQDPLKTYFLGDIPVSLRISHLGRTNIEEYYHYIYKDSMNSESLFEIRNNPNGANYSRLYDNLVKDDKTHCLLIEEGSRLEYNSKRLTITLYDTSYQEALYKPRNEFDYPGGVIFSLRYDPEKRMYELDLLQEYGRLLYYKQYCNGKEEDSSIYVCDSDYDTNQATVILVDGKTKLNKRDKNIPRRFFYGIFNELENNEYDSKAYFSTDRADVAVVKKDGMVMIYTDDSEDESMHLLHQFTSTSNSVGFSSEDFDHAINELLDLKIDNRLKLYVCKQLFSYYSTHSFDDFSKLNLPDVNINSFSQIKEFFENSDLVDITDNFLEKLSILFCDKSLCSYKLTNKGFQRKS